MASRSGPHTPPVRWTALLPLALLSLLLAVGCQSRPGAGAQAVADWTLDIPGAKPHPLRLPAHLGHELPERVLQYRLHTSVRLDPVLRGREVELVLVYLPAFVALRVNDQPVRLQGDHDASAEFGGHLPRRWLLPVSATQRDQAVQLELEVTHNWTRSARLDAVPLLVQAGARVPAAERNRLLNVQGGWFGMIGLSHVGLTFLVVYFGDRRRRAYLWFAIQALSAAYYPAYVLGLPGLLLGWPLQNILLAQSLAVAPIIAVYFAHEFFGLPPPHRVWLVFLALALLSPLTVAARDIHFHDMSYATVVVVLCVVAALVYQLALGVRLLRSYPDRRTVIFFLCCWVALGLASWPDLLAWLGFDLLVGGRSACLGLGLFSIFQSLLLGRSHFRSLAEADRLNEALRGQVRTLEERKDEIASLNDELRRQIGRRSEDILGALTASAASVDADLAPGQVVEARYRVLGTLGRGGMGTVYQVERLSDRKQLALKLSREVRGMALARLAREAQIATRVHHPNVVSVVDADVAQGGHAFLVMELVAGRTLAECQDQRPLVWCLEVLCQVLEGVRALHEQGVIHRDLKPNNILLADTDSAQPRVKITDFGISRWLDAEPLASAAESSSETQRSHVQTPETVQARAHSVRPGKSSPSLTQTGAIAGTPLYVAPELADKRAGLAPSVDVFSFGVVAYRLLTGKPPHLEAPLHARMAGREIAPVLPAAWVSAQVSEELSQLLDACLSPEPLDRPDVATILTLLRAELARWRDASEHSAASAPLE